MEDKKTKLWVIMFSDLKDFTLKTSLLTQKQINEILDSQDKLMLLNLKKYNWTLIKTIWDSYMIFFVNPLDALNFAVEIQRLLIEYNKDKKLNLQKIEIRISLNYWDLNQKETINWVDYFWDSVNLSSRLLSRTPETKIFITESFYDYVKNQNINCRFYFLWKTTFKWILYEVWVYEVVYNIEDIILFDRGEYNKIDYNSTIRDEKTKKRCKNIDDIIFRSSSVNTVLSIQPIPFIDMISSTAVYVYMLHQISLEYWIKLSQNQAKEIVLTILSAIWWALAINQIVSWVWKIWTMWLAWVLFVPLNFWTTYGVWKVMNRYFYNHTKELKLNNKEIKELFLSGKDYWVNFAKQNRKIILEKWKELKKEIIEYSKKTKNDLLEISEEIKKLKK